MVELAIDIGNGFRAWGVTAMLFAVPVVRAFFVLAVRRAVAASHDKTTRRERMRAFGKAFFEAGHYSNFGVNVWWAIMMLAFAGIAGGAIFVSSKFFGSFDTDGLNLVMMFMWGLLSCAAWGFTIETAPKRSNMGVAAGIMLVAVHGIALTLDGGA